MIRMLDTLGNTLPLRAAKRLAIVVIAAVPLCGYSLLWNISIVRYYSAIADPAMLSIMVPARAIVLQHLLLFPCLVALYYLATGAWWTSGRPPILALALKQAALVLIFGLLARPVLYLGYYLTLDRGSGTWVTFADFMDLDSWATSFVNYVPVYATGRFLIFGVMAFERYREEQLRVAALNTSLLQARLETLRVHLHPHFLFNTLNTISSLVVAQPETARDLIVALGTLLRDCTAEGYGDLHSVARECELSATYLRIVGVRFGDRLGYSISAPEALKRELIPHGMLLTLLENAVTHGVSSLTGACDVTVRLTVDGAHLGVEVRNSYEPRASGEAPHRGGLSALETRLRVLYGENYRLASGSDKPGVWSVRATLPPVARGSVATPLGQSLA